MVIYGAPETWKSWLGIELAWALDEGNKWLGLYETIPARVLLVQTEQVEAVYRDRIVAFSHSLNGSSPSNVLFATDLSLKIDNAFGKALLDSTCAEHKPDVFILDNLFHTISSERDEVVMKAATETFDLMREKYNVGCVITHHPRKEGDEDRGFDELSGSSVLARWADTIIKVTTVERRADIYQMDFQKTKNAKTRVSPIRFRANRSTVRLNIH